MQHVGSKSSGELHLSCGCEKSGGGVVEGDGAWGGGRRFGGDGGAGNFYEKYDGRWYGVWGEGGEYEVTVGFGWTNAVTLLLLMERGASFVATPYAWEAVRGWIASVQRGVRWGFKGVLGRQKVAVQVGCHYKSIMPTKGV